MKNSAQIGIDAWHVTILDAYVAVLSPDWSLKHWHVDGNSSDESVPSNEHWTHIMTDNVDLRMPTCCGINVEDLSIPQLQQYLQIHGTITSHELVECYLVRIKRINPLLRFGSLLLMATSQLQVTNKWLTLDHDAGPLLRWIQMPLISQMHWTEKGWMGKLAVFYMGSRFLLKMWAI